MKRKSLIITLCIALLIVIAAGIILWQINQEHPLFEKKPAMYMEPVYDRPQRTESHQQAYDFRTTDDLQSILLEVWELQDGQWVPFGGGRFGAASKNDRFSLAFDELYESITYALEGESYTYSINKSFATADISLANHVLYTTTQLQLKEIEYGKLIPMAMQIYTTNQNPQFIGVDFYHQPDLLASEGHEHVIAVTLTFSKEPME